MELILAGNYKQNLREDEKSKQIIRTRKETYTKRKYVSPQVSHSTLRVNTF